jgi:hypothetical protein
MLRMSGRSMHDLLAAALVVAAVIAPSGAIAQTTVGDILDDGAKRLSGEDFRQEVLQRPLQATLDPSITAEIVYTAKGSVEGAGSAGRARFGAEWSVDVRGGWTIDGDEKICTRIVLDGPTIRANYPPRCQYWFRHRDRFYVSPSKDRHARVLPRTPKD